MPKQLQRAMAAEQEAMRKAKAKIAAADGELQSATILREASETMAKNPIALQLRYLQTLSNVSAERNHTIVIPFPLDILRKVLGGGSNNPKSDEDPNADLENQKTKSNSVTIVDASNVIYDSRKSTLSLTSDSFFTAKDEIPSKDF